MTTAMTSQTPAPHFSLKESAYVNPSTLHHGRWAFSPLLPIPDERQFTISLFDRDTWVGTAILSPAANGRFDALIRLPEAALTPTLFLNGICIATDYDTPDTLAGLAYLALRRGRIEGFKNVVVLLPPDEDELATVLHLAPLTHLKPVKIDGTTFEAFAAKMDLATLRAFETCDGKIRATLKKHFIHEIIETHRRWLERFNQGSWYRAIAGGTISREQYVRSLQNLHQYVRQSTRLAARAIAYAAQDDIRDHFMNHMRGEINHELVIEHDLEHLGEDVAYVKHRMLPDSATNEFMMVQESTIGFHRDSLLFLACSMATEGITANLPPSFMEGLHRAIANWGVDQPKKACRFLASHIQFDGGDDGHFQMVADTIRKFIDHESKLQQFLKVLRAAMKTFERGFNANIDDMHLWSASGGS
ncbi:hypothetical protein SCOR_00640 [Sulfidibacter corallicola]|uniref:Uncharacterized protein n=1 Tax=Sulfidibacter corallicola TaxID=2818388 RepID=A0A8A4TGC1_SULCO|nr:hypothetical protein [Sulfidibacter corallicola]QTD48966.1 hypothetical protein J3U87_25560 [Sulfidibacter corallicola]